MGYKYKLKEEFAIGDIKVDGGVKSKVTNVDSNTGAITWNIEYVPNLSKLVEDSMELATTAKGVYQKAKDDKVFLDIYKQAKELRNLIRTHVRNNYPEDYKTAISEEDVDEMSTSGAAGSYLTPYAFRKKGAKADDEAYTELGYTVVKEDKSQYPSFEVDKNIKYQDTVITKGYWSYTGKESAGRGVYLNVMNQQMQAFNKEDIEIFQKNLPSHFNIIDEQYSDNRNISNDISNSEFGLDYDQLGPGEKEWVRDEMDNMNEAYGDGEDLGPGPKAGPEGVTDNAYVKQFKYKLVPKNKNGTYVQKGSGLEVKKLF